MLSLLESFKRRFGQATRDLKQICNPQDVQKVLDQANVLLQELQKECQYQRIRDETKSQLRPRRRTTNEYLTWQMEDRMVSDLMNYLSYEDSMRTKVIGTYALEETLLLTGRKPSELSRKQVLETYIFAFLDGEL